jgi:hypothetical protein
MDLKEFTFRLVVLFFPGLLAFMVFDRFTVHRKSEPFFFVTNSFVFGILAYCLTWVLSLGASPLLNAQTQRIHARWSLIPALSLPTKVMFWEELKDSSKSVELGEMGWTCGVGVCLALGASWISNRKIHYRIARRLGISKKSGELDVWAFVMNSREPETSFVTLRDTEADLIYDGWVHHFSEDHTTTELLLRDVVVYRNSTGEFLYQIGAMYFKIDPKKVVLEFRAVPVTERHKVEAKNDYEQSQSEPKGELHQRGIAEERRSKPHADQSAPAAAPGSTAAESSAPSPTPAQEVTNLPRDGH